MDRLTIEQLIAKKRQKDENEIKFKDIEVPSLGGTLLFNKPSRELSYEIMDQINEDSKTSEIAAVYKDFIYKSCPTLQDEQLRKEYNIADPLDIVDVFFEISDLLKVGNELSELAGIKEATNEEIKN